MLIPPVLPPCTCAYPFADIEAGQGMIAAGRNVFSGTDCPVNTYGVAARMYGRAAAPCKPCPRNMITDSAARVNSSDACVNPDGFGYASEGESNALCWCCRIWRVSGMIAQLSASQQHKCACKSSSPLPASTGLWA